MGAIHRSYYMRDQHGRYGSLREKEVAERLLDPATQHDHVQQQRRRNGDADDRERGAETVAAQALDAPAEATHPRPHSTRGRVCTSRQAAIAPAVTPSSTESTALKTTILGVINEKVSTVSKNRR
jgi:hypothetical protein